MSIVVTTELCCEHELCKNTFHGLKIQANKAAPRYSRKRAKEQGWSRVNGKDFCPDHKPVWKKVLVPAS